MLLKQLVWRVAISKITRAKKLLKKYRVSHSNLKTSVMMPDRRPEVKSVDAVNTLGAAPLKILILAWEVLQKNKSLPAVIKS